MLPCSIDASTKEKVTYAYLQCTTIGPPSDGFAFDEFLTKVTRGSACSGTPWSGQAVKWYWYTVRSEPTSLLLLPSFGASVLPFFRRKVRSVYEESTSSRRRVTVRSPSDSEPVSGQ